MQLEGQIGFVDGLKDAGRRLSAGVQRQSERVRTRFDRAMESLGPNGRKALRCEIRSCISFVRTRIQFRFSKFLTPCWSMSDAILAAFAYYLRKLGQKYVRLITVVSIMF